jgi:peptidoglycan/LPS O-acetylase OafA/YrhL
MSIASFKLPKYSFQWAGQFSYSLYLIHFPLLSMYFKVMSKFTLVTLPLWFVILLAICLCNLAAFMFYKYIESPLTGFFRIKLTMYRN